MDHQRKDMITLGAYQKGMDAMVEAQQEIGCHE
jgi:hypothetical protein